MEDINTREAVLSIVMKKELEKAGFHIDHAEEFNEAVSEISKKVAIVAYGLRDMTVSVMSNTHASEVSKLERDINRLQLENENLTKVFKQKKGKSPRVYLSEVLHDDKERAFILRVVKKIREMLGVSERAWYNGRVKKLVTRSLLEISANCDQDSPYNLHDHVSSEQARMLTGVSDSAWKKSYKKIAKPFRVGSHYYCDIHNVRDAVLKSMQNNVKFKLTIDNK